MSAERGCSGDDAFSFVFSRAEDAYRFAAMLLVFSILIPVLIVTIGAASGLQMSVLRVIHGIFSAFVPPYGFVMPC